MRSYETALIFISSLTEGDLDKGLERLTGIITENEGVLESRRIWGLRQFAYPIQKQDEGIYVFLRWQGAEKISIALDKHLKLDETCLRYLTLRVGAKSPVEYELQAREEIPLAPPSTDEEAPVAEPEAAVPIEVGESKEETGPAPVEEEPVAEEQEEPAEEEAPDAPVEKEELPAVEEQEKQEEELPVVEEQEKQEEELPVAEEPEKQEEPDVEAAEEPADTASDEDEAKAGETE